MTQSNYFGFLLQARTQAHLLHFQTKKYSEHIALEEFYTELLKLIDTLIEATQGPQDIQHITVKGSHSSEWQSSVEFMRWFKDSMDSNKSVFQETYQTNVIEDIETLTAQTLYKLIHLK